MSRQKLQANGYSQSKSRDLEQFKPDKDHSDWFDTMDKRGRAPRAGEYDREEEPASRRQQRVKPIFLPFSPCGDLACISVDDTQEPKKSLFNKLLFSLGHSDTTMTGMLGNLLPTCPLSMVSRIVFHPVQVRYFGSATHKRFVWPGPQPEAGGTPTQATGAGGGLRELDR